MKQEYIINKWVADTLVEYLPGLIIDAKATKEEENYGVDDIIFTSVTYNVYPLESKTLKGGFNFMKDGKFTDYFTRDIYKKLAFEDTGITSGTPVYFVNAEDRNHRKENGKWNKLLEARACLSYLAPEGIYIFSPKSLKDAFIGYADYWVSPTTEIGKPGPKHPEKKAILDMSKSTYIHCTPPPEFFIKLPS